MLVDAFFLEESVVALAIVSPLVWLVVDIYKVACLISALIDLDFISQLTV